MLPTIVVIAGTRPEALKLLPVIDALRHGGVGAVRLIASGQHQTLFDQMLPDIAPDMELGLMQEGDPPGRFLARAAAVLAEALGHVRSEERRVGKECVSTCRSRWSPSH